ncbi:FliH/SctL family protein [Xanthobacteraceae bacterium Astr-EGSB]|uniref:FliH/SctL family protein n=1 Tax=Astrobacterium formosum TaxID=3069710 RepID=UPI0027B40AA7|nr:FliH/SctL family protein [Xanthobacteraceae bacterium Astr-EGSB]
MAAPAKFLFDLDFGPSAPVKTEVPTVPLADHERALAEAEMRGYKNGMAAAEVQARTEAERRTAAAFERIAVGLAGLDGRLTGIQQRLEAEAVEVAVEVARKLASALIAREPLGEIAALAEGCFRELLAAPHVVVRVHESLYAEAKDRLQEIARSRGFEGRLVVMGENDLAVGDCRIEWADGGLVRERATIEAAISDAVDRYVAIRRGGEH